MCPSIWYVVTHPWCCKLAPERVTSRSAHRRAERVRRHPCNGRACCIAENAGRVPIPGVSSKKDPYTEVLLDHLVGAGDERRWHIEAEQLGGLEIEDQLHLGGPAEPVDRPASH